MYTQCVGVCVCVCVRACVRACVCVCACVRACACVSRLTPVSDIGHMRRLIVDNVMFSQLKYCSRSKFIVQNVRQLC